MALGPAGAIARLDPDGSWEEPLDMPAGFVTSLCFTGSGLDGLAITAAGGDDGGVLLAAEVAVPGFALAPGRA